MNCAWQERAALHAGGDLPEIEARAVEQHLAECSGCRILTEELRADLAGWRVEFLEPIDPSQYVRLRARVMERIRMTQVRSFPWRMAWAAGVLAAILLLLFAPRPAPRLATIRRPAPAPVMAVAAAPPERVESHTRRRVVRKAALRQPPRAEAPAEPIVLKLLTNDPNVVIYWITDTKGDYQ